MTIVSSKEFASNQNKYFDMAIKKQVFVQGGNNMFHLTCTNNVDTNGKERLWYEPDKDFYRSITKDELMKGINEDIDDFFVKS